MNIIQVPALRSNYGQKRSYPLKHIVMHWMCGTLVGTDSWFKNPSAKASSHYGIGKNGEIHQYVSEEYNAWHAGPSVNFESLGIEHEGGPGNNPTRACCDASAELVADICKRYNLPCNTTTVTKHNQYMSTECPGTLDVSYIIQKANSIINNTPMIPFDFILSKVGSDIHLIMNQPATGPFIVKDKTTGNTTDTGNILNGADKIVSPNCTKRLYEVTFNGVTHEIDLRDAPPVVPPTETCEAKLATALAKVTELNTLNIELKSDLDKQVVLYRDLQEWIGTLNDRIDTLSKLVDDKDKEIEDLKNIQNKKFNLIEWILSIFKK